MNGRNKFIKIVINYFLIKILCFGGKYKYQLKRPESNRNNTVNFYSQIT